MRSNEHQETVNEDHLNALKAEVDQMEPGKIVDKVKSLLEDEPSLTRYILEMMARSPNDELSRGIGIGAYVTFRLLKAASESGELRKKFNPTNSNNNQGA